MKTRYYVFTLSAVAVACTLAWPLLHKNRESALLFTPVQASPIIPPPRARLSLIPEVTIRSEVVSNRVAVAMSEELADKILNDSTRNAVIAALSKAAGARLQYVKSPLPDVYILQIDELTAGTRGAIIGKNSRRRLMNDVITRLSAIPGIQKIEEDMLMFPSSTPDDSLYSEQWYLQPGALNPGSINAADAWEKSTGAGVVVAVVDTGITDHPDLAANVLPGYDFVIDGVRGGDGDGWDADPHDMGDFITAQESTDAASPFNGCPEEASSWHGTHVAGIIAAQANNGTGVSGVAPGAKILPVRVLGKCGGYATDIAAGIYWSSGAKTLNLVPQNPNPAKIINLSLGGLGSCPFFYASAIMLAKKAGSTIVAAAGNANMDASKFAPANCSGVVVVGAVGKAGARSFYSNHGSRITVSAPGGDSRSDGTSTILSTLNDGETTPGAPIYKNYQGTSMATPVVAGAIALTMGARPRLSSADAAQVVISKASDFPAGTECVTGGCGKGIVNAFAAVGHAETMGVDLAVDSIRMTDDALIPSIPTEFTAKVANRGNVAMVGDLTIKTWLSKSNALDGTAILLKEMTKAVKIPINTVMQTGMSNIVVPAGTLDGVYYLHVSLTPTPDVLVKPGSTFDDSKTTAALPVAMPQIVISRKMSVNQAPMSVSYSQSILPSSHTRRMQRSDMTKMWTFSNGAIKNGFATTTVFTSPGDHTATATINHQSGFTVTSTDTVTLLQAPPFAATLIKKAGNATLREPLLMGFSLALTGGHPLDRPRQTMWSLDNGTPISKNAITYQNIPAGPHTIKAVMTSNYGATVSAEDSFIVIPNIPPTCTLSGAKNASTLQATFVAGCTDPDGKIKRYEWFINGTRTTGWSSTFRSSYSGTGTMIASVKVTDDGGAVATNEFTLSY